MSSLRIVATALTLGLGVSAALTTATVAATQSLTTVEVQPHELDTARGRAAVLERIGRAAERYCSKPGVTGRTFDRACARQTSETMLGKLSITERLALSRSEASGPDPLA